MLIDKLKHLLKSDKEYGVLSQTDNCQLIDNILRGVGCTVNWEEEEGDKVASFAFQGGNFYITVPKSCAAVRMWFPSFYSAGIDFLNLVREVCNQVNSRSDGLRVVYTYDAKQNTVDLHFLENLLLDEERGKNILVECMKSMFYWRNVFAKWFDEAHKEQNGSTDSTPEEDNFKTRRMQMMLREHQLTYFSAPMEVRESANQRITLGDFASKAMRLGELIPSRMDIAGDGISISIDASEDNTRRKEMSDYALSDALIADGKFARRFATINLVFFKKELPDERRYLTLTLVADKQSEDALYFLATGVLSPLLPTIDHPGEDIGGLPKACSTLMAYDLKNEKQFADEFQFMWNDAKDKIEADKTDDLTDEQRFIASTTNLSVASCLFRGRRLFFDKRYFEATLLLRNAFDLWGKDADRMPAGERRQFFELCFMLGYCYDQLGHYDAGYYYLSLLDTSECSAYLHELINNQALHDDPRVLNHINSLLTDIRRHVEDETGKPMNDYEAAQHPDYHDLACFLLSTRVEVLMKRDRDKEAEKELRELLKIPDLETFATLLLADLEAQTDQAEEADPTPSEEK